MRRAAFTLPLAAALPLAAVLMGAGPAAAAEREVFEAHFDRPGIAGTVRVDIDAARTGGTISAHLEGIEAGKAVVDLDGGTCNDRDGGVATVTTDREHFVDGRWNFEMPLPDDSAHFFWNDWHHRGGVTATIRNDGRSTCESFHLKTA